MNNIKMIPENELSKIKRILIIQYKPFGDILLNTAYMPALRKKFPDATIDYLVQRPYKTLIEDNPNLDNLVIMEKKKGRTLAYYVERIKTIFKVRKLKYDMVIDQIRGPGSAQITMFSGAKYRLGWNKTAPFSWLKGYNWVYNYRAKRNPVIYYAIAKFIPLECLGIKYNNENIFYHIKSESKEYIKNWLIENDLIDKKKVVFSPVTPVLRKQWEFERFAKVADLIKEKSGYEVILLWGPGEQDKVEFMASNMKTKPFMAPKTTFNEAGAMLKEVDVYLGNDGGINHLAVAMDTPTISIFGPKTDPLKWVAWHLDIHKYLSYPYLGKFKDHTFDIEPEEVYEKFVELIDIIKNKEV